MYLGAYDLCSLYTNMLLFVLCSCTQANLLILYIENILRSRRSRRSSTIHFLES